MVIRVTVEDVDTGETETREIENDYILVCAGNRRYSVQAHGNGTHVITIKRKDSDQ